jgi:hypothetical protein
MSDSHHGPPVHPAFRARCEWLALRQPRRTDAQARAANFLSSAGDPRPVSRIIAAWASARRDTSFAPTRPPHPAPRLATLMKRPLLRGGTGRRRAGEGGKNKEFYPSIGKSCFSCPGATRCAVPRCARDPSSTQSLDQMGSRSAAHRFTVRALGGCTSVPASAMDRYASGGAISRIGISWISIAI